MVAGRIFGISKLLREFGLVTGLKINFSKIRILGIHVKDSILNATSSFLSCRVRYMPFKFLGVKVEGSPKRDYMLSDVLDNLKRQLCTLKSILISMGGIAVLLNFVLNYIPLYTLSFYKAPCKVIQQINDI